MTHRSAQRWQSVSFALATLTLCGAALRADTGPSAAPHDEKSGAMKSFVFLFRQGPRQLTEAELKRRADEVRAWALEQNSNGHKLDPRILDAQLYRLGPDGDAAPVEASSERPITAILFVAAHDFADATRIAKSHPGLRYGASVEVRGWGPPTQPATPANAQSSAR